MKFITKYFNNTEFMKLTNNSLNTLPNELLISFTGNTMIRISDELFERTFSTGFIFNISRSKPSMSLKGSSM